MASIRARAGGFTLIELLVVIAIIAVLIGLLIPNTTAVREAAAKQVGKNAITEVLCPWSCYGLAIGEVSLNYPQIPAGLMASEVLAWGMRIRYDKADIEYQVFRVYSGDSDPAQAPFGVAFELDAEDFDAPAFALLDVAYTEPGVEFLVQRTTDGQLLKLTASVDAPSLNITVAPSQVPEPATWWLVLAALAFPALKRLGSSVRAGWARAQSVIGT